MLFEPVQEIGPVSRRFFLIDFKSQDFIAAFRFDGEAVMKVFEMILWFSLTLKQAASTVRKGYTPSSGLQRNSPACASIYPHISETADFE